MKAQELFDPRDRIHEQLNAIDWDTANKQLYAGVSEDLVYECCRGWAQVREYESQADTQSALDTCDWDYGFE